MSIFLLILKIIGIILLVLLGMILFLVLLVLFCPLCYKAKGTLYRKYRNVHASVFWLFGILAVCVDVKGESTDLYLRICGIRKSFSGENDNSGNSEDTIEECKEVRENEIPVAPVMPDKDSSVKENSLTAQEVPAEDSSRHGIFSKFREFRDHVKDTCRSVRRMFQEGKKTLHKISTLWENDSCRKGIQSIVSQLLTLLGRLIPYKFQLELTFSTGSPDTTGELLGILSMFPIGYQNRWKITPDFTAEEAYVDGTFDIRGRLFGFEILIAAIGIVLDKNCRKLYNRLIR